jgi:predicted nucleic acid-binding protein
VKAFFDTNVLIYAASSDPRSIKARQTLQDGGIISVQVLNEFTNVCRSKLRLDWPRIEEALNRFRDALEDVISLTVEIHAAAVALSRDHGIAFYDALIVAAALEAGCQRLYSEDLQHGRKFGDLAIVNPFL